jgi:type II secretory pathway pseudopilin PulG
MTARTLTRRTRSRLHGERGFTIVETVVAMVVIFASLTALAYTATIGFRYIAYGRDRQQATGLANQIMEEIRGQAYSVITRGMSTTDITSDARIVTCSTVKRFETCSGPKVVSSSVPVGTAAPWLIPHSGTRSVGNLEVSWATYVTNDDPAANPYSVTVIVSWGAGALAQGPNNLVRIESNFWSPSGCVSSDTHPFAAPCQPYFYGLASVPAGSVTFGSINLHELAVDLDRATVSFPSARASLQQEQVSNLEADAVESALSISGTFGLTEAGGSHARALGDNDPSSPTVGTSGATLNAPGSSLQKIQSDCCDEIGLQLAAAAGQVGDSAVSTAAKATDAAACPPSGTRETDSLSCAGARVKQVNAVTAVTPVDHAAAVGDATVVRLAAPASYSTATAERDAVSGQNGLVDVQASRTLGNIYLGGYPTSGMTAPSGMSVTNTSENNYCMRITGYADTARIYAGARAATAPAASITGGTFYYYDSGTGTYLSKAVTDPSLSTLTINCTPASQTIGGKTVTWKVTVAAGDITPASVPAATNQTLSTDSQTRLEQEATVSPIKVTFRFRIIVNSTDEVDLKVTIDPGTLVARGIYGPPPSAG